MNSTPRSIASTQVHASECLPCEAMSWNGGERTLAEKLAARRFRGHAAASKPVPGKEPAQLASFARLRFVLQERELLEASLARGRPQRAPRGAKKLQSSWYPPAACVVEHSSIHDAASAMINNTVTIAPDEGRRLGSPKLSQDLGYCKLDARRLSSPKQSLNLHNTTVATIED